MLTDKETGMEMLRNLPVAELGFKPSRSDSTLHSLTYSAILLSTSQKKQGFTKSSLMLERMGFLPVDWDK